MTDIKDHDPTKKSIPDLRAIQGGGESPHNKPQEKRKFRDIHLQIASAMAGKPLGWQQFPVKIHRMIDFRGENLIYVENDNKIVRNVADAYLNSLIADYWNKTLPSGDRPVYLGSLSADNCDKTRKLWYALAPAITKPFPLVTWASDPRPSHHKVPFDPLPIAEITGRAPLFFELLGRMTNAHAFMAFIGSLFDEHSQRQQYVWIYGDGMNGKGALIRAIQSVLGDVISSEQPPSRDSKHWTVGLMGKRLVVFPDCEDPSFARSGLFKSLTGEDRIRVEIKGGAILFMDMPTKFLFTSNKKPDISPIKADLRRIIFCPIKPVVHEIDNYEATLATEVPYFISACWHHYLQVTKGNPRAEIRSASVMEVTELAARNEIDCESFVDAYIEVIDSEVQNPELDNNKRTHIRCGDMFKLMNHLGFRRDRTRLIEYMARKHGIQLKNIKTPSSSYDAYLNCRLNLSAEAFLTNQNKQK